MNMFSSSSNMEWQVKFASDNPGTPLFSDDILSRYAGLRSTKIWKEEHDLVLLHAVLKYVSFFLFLLTKCLLIDIGNCIACFQNVVVYVCLRMLPSIYFI